MEVLGWLLIPLAALILGLAWAAWRSRDRKPVDAERGMEGMARFREAMEKPLPALDTHPIHPDPDAGPGSGADERDRDR